METQSYFLYGLRSACLFAACLLINLSNVFAQESNAASADPLDAAAIVCDVIYESSFSQYRAFENEKIISWQAANDHVAALGGWRKYAAEAAGEVESADTDEADISKPADHSSMHDAHRGHQTESGE
ncbi:MAG: hypothetical protein H0W44_00375 [Gammaproteobacteria bacterium]|nr:hypothetical protein [Gammaproteobacteria bacterium]